MTYAPGTEADLHSRLHSSMGSVGHWVEQRKRRRCFSGAPTRYAHTIIGLSESARRSDPMAETIHYNYPFVKNIMQRVDTSHFPLHDFVISMKRRKVFKVEEQRGAERAVKGVSDERLSTAASGPWTCHSLDIV
jgi:hypothetical protein